MLKLSRDDRVQANLRCPDEMNCSLSNHSMMWNYWQINLIIREANFEA
jgi:hypothetical protein